VGGGGVTLRRTRTIGKLFLDRAAPAVVRIDSSF